MKTNRAAGDSSNRVASRLRCSYTEKVLFNNKSKEWLELITTRALHWRERIEGIPLLSNAFCCNGSWEYKKAFNIVPRRKNNTPVLFIVLHN